MQNKIVALMTLININRNTMIFDVVCDLDRERKRGHVKTKGTTCYTSATIMQLTGTKYIGEAIWAELSIQSTTHHAKDMQKTKCFWDSNERYIAHLQPSCN